MSSALIRYRIRELTFERRVLCITLLLESVYIAVAVAFLESEPVLEIVCGGIQRERSAVGFSLHHSQQASKWEVDERV